MAEVREDRRYQESHEWATIEESIVTIGISDFAQDALGDVVYFDLPEVGTELKKGESFAEVESVKAVSDVYAPFDGVIVEVNENLEDNPALINEEPYEGGWMIKMRIDSTEYETLLDAAAYTASCS